MKKDNRVKLYENEKNEKLIYTLNIVYGIILLEWIVMNRHN